MKTIMAAMLLTLTSLTIAQDQRTIRTCKNYPRYAEALTENPDITNSSVFVKNVKANYRKGFSSLRKKYCMINIESYITSNRNSGITEDDKLTAAHEVCNLLVKLKRARLASRFRVGVTVGGFKSITYEWKPNEVYLLNYSPDFYNYNTLEEEDGKYSLQLSPGFDICALERVLRIDLNL